MTKRPRSHMWDRDERSKNGRMQPGGDRATIAFWAGRAYRCAHRLPSILPAQSPSFSPPKLEPATLIEPSLRTELAALAAIGGLAALAACGLTLALLGLGLPYIAGAAFSGLCAALLIYAVGRWLQARRLPPPGPVPRSVDDPAIACLALLQREMSTLRHELRGALSPALMVTDRLLRDDDPLVRRAGDAVVRSVERATALIGKDQPRPPLGDDPTLPAG